VADETRPTEAFKTRVSEAYASLRPGMEFVARRTFGDGDIAMFVGATADYNVWHVDDAAIDESWFERRVVPGLLTASLTTQIGSWLGWLATRMDFQFLRPVYAGETITCTCTVTNKDDESRRIACDVVYRNAEGTVVMRGIMEGFPTRIPPAAQPFLDRDAPS
jgi:3-hydroxybutyryl-CoA dehydratase